VGFLLIFLFCISAIGGHTLLTVNEIKDTGHLEFYKGFNKMSLDYQPVSLSRLIGVSELIVSGNVEVVTDSLFVFNVEKTLFGIVTEKTIKVQQYIPVAFNESRQNPYAAGQGFILFLKEHNVDEIQYQIIGLGGEGEIPVEDGYVYFPGLLIEGLQGGMYGVHGKQRYLTRFEFKDFTDAVKRYHNCFSWSLTEETRNNKKRMTWNPVKECTDESLQEYQEKSWIHEYLVKETNNKMSEVDIK